MKYYSDKLDKIFDTAADLIAEELEYDKRVAEAEAREVESAYKHYLELKDAYVKKYHSDCVLNATNDLLGGLLNLLFKD